MCFYPHLSYQQVLMSLPDYRPGSHRERIDTDIRCGGLPQQRVIQQNQRTYRSRSYRSGSRFRCGFIKRHCHGAIQRRADHSAGVLTKLIGLCYMREKRLVSI